MASIALLAALGFLTVLVILVRNAGAASTSHGGAPALEGQPVRRRSAPSAQGVVQLHDGGWLLTPGWTFPLSVRGCDGAVASEIKRTLEQGLESRPESIYQPLASLLLSQGVQVDQVEEFFRVNGPKYRAELARLAATRPEDSDEDFSWEATETLDVWIPQDPQALFEEAEPLTPADLEAIAHFGQDALAECTRGKRAPGVIVTAEDGEYRKSICDALVAKGLAETSESIPPPVLLPELHVPELRRMVTAAGGPSFKRKADAVAFLKDRPDVATLLAGAGCTRHFYRLLPLGERFAGASLERITKHTPRAFEAARLLADTYFATACASRDMVAYAKSGVVAASKVLTANDEVVCPCCQRMGKKRRLGAGDPRPPFHLGCRCVTVALTRR